MSLENPERDFGDFELLDEERSARRNASKPGHLSQADAHQIEQECHLPFRSIAADREMTAAEMVYLACPNFPRLAIHVDLYLGGLALVVYEFSSPTMSKEHLKGAELESNVEIERSIKQLWAGLTLARSQGLKSLLSEDLAVVLTGWVDHEPNRRFSWSARAESVTNIFTNAPRPLLLGPKFVPVPPPGKDMPSPGLCIDSVQVESFVEVHSIVFQGVSTLENKDGPGLLNLVNSDKAKSQ